MVGPGAGLTQDPAGAPGIGEPAPHRLGEIGGANVVRTGGDEHEPAWRGEARSEPRQFAVAA